ncbi:MAG: hypothetical protein AAFS00_09935 [Bacteroidota bacterium]
MSAEQFEQRIRGKVEGARMQPSPELWAAIEQQIAPKSSHRYLFWWWTGGFLMLALVALGIYFKPFTTQEHLLPPHFSQSETEYILPQSPSSAELEEACLEAYASLYPPTSLPSSSHTNRNRTLSRISTHLLATDIPSELPTSDVTQWIISQPALLQQIDFQAHKLPSIRTSLAHPVEAPHVYGESMRRNPNSAMWSIFVQGGWGYGRMRIQDFVGEEAFLPASTASNDIVYSDTYDFNAVPIPSQNTDTIQVNRVAYPRYQQRLQISLGKQIRRWGLRVGLSFRRSEQGRIETGFLPTNFVPIGEVDIAELSLNQPQTVTFSQTQIDVPIALDFYLKRGASNLVLTAGWAASYNANRSKQVGFTQSPEASSDPLLTFNQWHSYAMGGIRYEQAISRELSVFIQPSFHHNLSAAYNNTSTAATQQNRMRIHMDFGLKKRLW